MANAIIGLNAKLYYLSLPTGVTRGRWPQTGDTAQTAVALAGTSYPDHKANGITDIHDFDSAAGSFSGDITELDNVRDVTLNAEKTLADVSTRGGGGWRQQVGTLKDGSIETQMVWDPSDPGFTAMAQAFYNNETIAMAVLSGVKKPAAGIPTISGLWAEFDVTNFTRNEGLEEGLVADVTFVITSSVIPPQWIELTSGS